MEVFVLCPPDTDTPGLTIENQTKPPETKAVTAGGGLMKPEAVAAAMIRGMEKGRFITVPGFEGKFSVLAQRLIPGFVRWTLDRTIAEGPEGITINRRQHPIRRRKAEERMDCADVTLPCYWQAFGWSVPPRT